mgnify:FL=1
MKICYGKARLGIQVANKAAQRGTISGTRLKIQYEVGIKKPQVSTT